MRAIRELFARLGRAWNRHPLLFGIPAGAVLAAAMIALGLGDGFFFIAWGVCILAVVLRARGGADGDDEW